MSVQIAALKVSSIGCTLLYTRIDTTTPSPPSTIAPHPHQTQAATMPIALHFFNDCGAHFIGSQRGTTTRHTGERPAHLATVHSGMLAYRTCALRDSVGDSFPYPISSAHHRNRATCGNILIGNIGGIGTIPRQTEIKYPDDRKPGGANSFPASIGIAHYDGMGRVSFIIVDDIGRVVAIQAQTQAMNLASRKSRHANRFPCPIHIAHHHRLAVLRTIATETRTSLIALGEDVREERADDGTALPLAADDGTLPEAREDEGRLDMAALMDDNQRTDREAR